MKENKILIVIVIISAILRFLLLGKESLWLDEGYSVKIAQTNIAYILQNSSFDPHPPLYLILLYFWIKVFGYSEFAARAFSALFGIASVVIIYFVSKELFNKKVGLISSGILAVSVFHIRYSQEVRSYSLLAFLTLLSFYFLIMLNKKHHLSMKIGYTISTVLMLYTHNYALFIVAAQNLYMLSVLKKEYKKWIILQLIILFLYIPGIILVMHQTKSVYYSWITPPTSGDLLDTLTQYSGSIPLLIFYVLFFGYLAVRKINRQNNILLIVWFFVPILLPFLFSLLVKPIFLTRGTIGASFSLYIWVAMSIDKLKSKKLVISSFVALSILGLFSYYSDVNKEQWRETTSFIEFHAKKGDLVAFDVSYTKDLVYDYYVKRADLVYFTNTNKENYQNILWRYPYVWLVVSHSADNGQFIRGELLKSHKIQASYHYIGIELYYFVRP